MSSLSPDGSRIGDPPSASARPRIAIAHDWLVACRGGEAVLAAIVALARQVGDISAVYTLVSAGPRFESRCTGRYAPLRTLSPVRTSALQHIPGATGAARRWLLPLFPLAVTHLSRRLAADHRREPVDLLISTSSAVIKGLRPPPGVPHLCYCHAPARYLWSITGEYARGQAGGLRALGLRLCREPLKAWDRRTAANVTRFLANSTYIASQIRRCYQRDAEVVFPPVDTAFYSPDPSVARTGHWLYAGALEPYKRVDLLIHAAARARHPLTIVGEGSQSEHLRALAGPTVTFRGRIDDAALRREYQSARLVLFPQIEDFGIVAVEAQACGTPVLAFRAGGALDTVIDGRTGAFFDHPSADHLIAAAARVPENSAATLAACRDNALRFAAEGFDERMREQIHGPLSVSPGRGRFA